VSEVKWFKLKQETADPENKNVTVSPGDLASAEGNGQKGADFSNGPKEFTLANTPQQFYGEFRSEVNDNSIRQKLDGKNIYELTFTNKGGLVTPLVIEWTYKDGSKEVEKIPAEVWRINETRITKVFVKQKEVTNIVLDPNFELADIDVSNNMFPRKAESQFDRFRKGN
jgi:hypothetical protein